MTQNTNMVLKENQVGELALPSFKTYYKPTVFKTVLFGERIGGQNRELRKRTHQQCANITHQQ